MLQVAYLRDNRAEVIERTAKRGMEVSDLVDRAISLDDQRRKVQRELDEKKADLNRQSKQIGALYQEGKGAEAEKAKQKTSELKEETGRLRKELQGTEKALREVLYDLPNVPHQSVPPGEDDSDNEIVKEEGTPLEPLEGAQPHWEVGKDLGILDLEGGVRVTGAGFPVYKGKGAKLQRALISYFLDEALKRDYFEVQPPLLVNSESGTGTGQLPDKEGQMYQVQGEDLFLIPTAEVPLTNLYRETLLGSSELPVKLVGYTPCFRREAGSYGKDVRGLNRLHQFDKVEIVQVRDPESSYQALEEMVEHACDLLRALDLPFRVARLCGGDLGFAAALTYDLEVYSRVQDKWLEVSSVSNFESYQAHRMNLRYKDDRNNKTLLHTLNGSALALARLVAALLEHYQESGSVRVPEVLVPYTGFDRIEKP